MPLPVLLSGSDSELQHEVFHKFRRGDRGSFKTIFEFYYGSVYKFVHAMIGQREDAADIASDTFVTLWRKKEKLRHPQKLKSYLFTISGNAARNYLKHQKVAEKYAREIRQTTDPVVDERGAMYEAEFFAHLEQVMVSLPEGYKSVFEMIYLENLNTEEIAGKLNISRQTVLNQKNKAIQLLRKALHKKNSLVLLELYETFVRHHH